MNVKTNSGEINSYFHTRREGFAFTALKYEIDNPEIMEIDIILTDVIKDCKDKNFHCFEEKCKFDSEFKHETSGEVFYITKTNVFNLSTCQSDRLFNKIEGYEKDGYKLTEIIKLTLKIKSSLSYLNISLCLKLRIPKLHVNFS